MENEQYMIVVIISLIVLVAGICMMIYKNKSYLSPEVVWLIGMILLVVGSVSTIASGCVAIYTKASENYKYEVICEEYSSLKARLEKAKESPNESIVEMNSLYEDVYNYNVEVRRNKYWASNPWINWFYNQKIAKYSEYIEVEK